MFLVIAFGSAILIVDTVERILQDGGLQIDNKNTRTGTMMNTPDSTQNDTADLSAKLSALSTSLNSALSPRDQDFLRSMAASIERWGWTPARERVILGLHTRATRPASATRALRSVSGIKDLFDAARSRIKYPALTLTPDGFTPIRISVAGERSKFNGAIIVTSPERNAFGRRTFYGHISLEGVWTPSGTAAIMDPEDRIGAFLVLFAAKPAEIASAYGRKTGCCCFCMRPLGGTSRSAKHSVAAGFGEVCAKSWGLHALWKTAASEHESGLVA